MGEANRRGTKEVRVAQGIAKRKKAEEDRAEALRQYEISLTPAQIEQRKKARAFITTISGIAAASKIS